VRGRTGGYAARAFLIAVVVGALALPPLSASGALPGPLNDLLSLGQGGGETPATVPIQRNAEPPFVATPRAHCGPGSRREPGIQGRVSVAIRLTQVRETLPES